MNATAPTNPVADSPSDSPRVGISQCLLGAGVRYDGGHKRDRFIVDVLGDYFAWHWVCPEVEVGMGTPREPIRLVAQPSGVRLIGVTSGEDWTGRMHEYARVRCDELASDELRGFILKKDSPSCGMARVKVFDHNSVPSKSGTGLFAQQLLDRFPNLPVEEEGRLNDRPLRENFVLRVYTYDRWRKMLDCGPRPADLVRFHSNHKLLLMAHDPGIYYAIGPRVAEAGSVDFDALLVHYEEQLMRALARPAPIGRQVNTLHHIMGFLKDRLSAADKVEILDVIEQYRAGVVPLVTPLTLLKHRLREVDRQWIHDQVYLDPYPRELALRSHV